MAFPAHSKAHHMEALPGAVACLPTVERANQDPKFCEAPKECKAQGIINVKMLYTCSFGYSHISLFQSCFRGTRTHRGSSARVSRELKCSLQVSVTRGKGRSGRTPRPPGSHSPVTLQVGKEIYHLMTNPSDLVLLLRGTRGSRQ